MKIIINKTTLLQAVTTAGKAVAPNPTTPALNNLLITAVGGGVSVGGTNLETTIKTWVPAKIITKGETTAPARVLSEHLSNLKEETVNIAADKEILTIKTTTVSARIPTISAEEFPTTRNAGKAKGVEVKKTEFAKTVREVAPAASQDESRLALTGVLFKPGKNNTIVVATDGYRLAVKEATNMATEEVIIPTRDLMEVSKILSNTEADTMIMNITQENNQAVFLSDRIEYHAKLIAGEFPNYEQIIPTKFVTTVRLDKEPFTNALKIAAAFAKDLGNVVHLTLKDKGSSVSGSSAATGESKASIDADVSGQDLNIAFNSRYIADAVKAIPSDKIEMRFAGPVNPALLKSATDDSLIYIIMPVRTQT